MSSKLFRIEWNGFGEPAEDRIKLLVTSSAVQRIFNILTRNETTSITVTEVLEPDQTQDSDEPQQITYKIGTRFQHKHGQYILAQSDDCKAVLISLHNGNRWKGSVKVKDIWEITIDEFNQITDNQSSNFTQIKEQRRLSGTGKLSFSLNEDLLLYLDKRNGVKDRRKNQ